MTETDAPSQHEAGLDLREHDREVLDFLSHNPSSLMGFQGLRRQLGIHPEQLSRALRRLAVDGLVEQTELGYRVTQRALNLLNPAATEEDRNGVMIIQGTMPGDVDARSLVLGLKGTWFGSLRWQGLTESVDGLRLSWITSDNLVRIDAQIQGGQLTISAHVSFQEQLDEAIRLGHMLFQHISRAFSREDFSAVSA